MTEEGVGQPREKSTVEAGGDFHVVDSWDDPDKPIAATVPRPRALGPDADPTFPSLPAGASERPEMREEPLLDGAVSTVPLTGNVFALARNPTPIAPIPVALGVVIHPEEFDRPERQRIAAIASDFVGRHVRVVRRDSAMKARHRHFGVGTIVISEDPVPTTVLRHARFQWAITDGTVVELRNVRLPVSDIAPYQPLPTITDGDGWPMAESGLAVYLAFLFESLGISAGAPLGALGDINFNTNSIGAVSNLDVYLHAAQSGALRDLMLPFANGKASGMHNQVRYWSVRDTNEAAYSALTHLAGEVIVPNLHRRALTKQAYSWFALSFALAAVLAYALAYSVNDGGDAPRGFLEVVLAIVVLFMIGSETCTRRYWKRDT